MAVVEKIDKGIDELYTDFLREMNTLEEQRETITKKINKNEKDQGIFEDISREMKWMFKEVKEHCQEEQFILSMENCEDEFYDCQRNIENELEEKREFLETERRNTYRKEEELRDNLHRKKMAMNKY